MRGTLVLLIFAAISTGIIPAYAGNTESMRPLSLYLGDHPRVCGEHLGGDAFNLANGGSSPRMRGTQTVVLSTSSSPGIIPAYAGNTLKMCCRIMMTRDHPRVCGEHTRKAYRNTISSGSSPRMRGTPGRFHNLRDETGIIPAYAGNTYATVNVQVAVWDHPRVCGEHCR